MVAKLGGEQAFQQAIADGDLVEVKDGGSSFFVYRQIEAGRETGTESKHGFERQAVVSDDAFELGNKMLDSLSWSLPPLTAKDQVSIKQGTLPAKVLQKVDEAKSGMQRMLSVAQRCLKDLQAGARSPVRTAAEEALLSKIGSMLDEAAALDRLLLRADVGIDQLKGVLSKCAVALQALYEAASEGKSVLTNKSSSSSSK